MKRKRRKELTWRLGSVLVRWLASGGLLARLLMSCTLAGIPAGTLARLLVPVLIAGICWCLLVLGALLVWCLACLAWLAAWCLCLLCCLGSLAIELSPCTLFSVLLESIFLCDAWLILVMLDWFSVTVGTVGWSLCWLDSDLSGWLFDLDLSLSSPLWFLFWKGVHLSE